MALLFYDGFEGLSDSATAAAGLPLRYGTIGSTAGGVSASTTPAPINGRALLVNSTPIGNSVRAGRGVTAHGSGIVGFRLLACQSTGVDIAGGRILSLHNSANNVIHISITLTSGGVIEVRRGDASGTILGSSAGNTITKGQWYYVEMKYIIDDTNGGIQVRVNGVDVLKLGAYADTPTTLDTRNGGTVAEISRIDFCNNLASTASQPVFDDWYVCDLTGSAPYNNFLGEIRVLEIIPDGAGDSTDFTPDTGSNWQRVDETPGMDSDTSYVQSDTAGDEDLYNLTASSSNAPVILAVKNVTVARKTDAGEQELELLVKSGTTTDASAVQTMTSSFAEYTNVWLQNPDTTADWTLTDVNALQSGFRIPV